MSGRKWPLGSEVRRKDLTGGVMLYDASRAGNAQAGWFDAGYWKERNEVEGEARGRGTTHFVRSGRQQFVLRHYRRGGLIAKAMGDRYFWRSESATRSFSEWQLLYHLHRAGLPVPAPIAARYRRHGLLYTADLITERLTDSISLAEQLRTRGIPILGWITIGRCIRAFHDLGVCHPDLNAHNILLVGDDSVYLIDFDRGRLLKPGLWCDGNLVRLRRSLEKITYKLPPEHFGEADWHGLLDGYRESGGMPGAPHKATPVRASSAPDAGSSSISKILSLAAESGPEPAVAAVTAVATDAADVRAATSVRTSAVEPAPAIATSRPVATSAPPAAPSALAAPGTTAVMATAAVIATVAAATSPNAATDAPLGEVDTSVLSSVAPASASALEDAPPAAPHGAPTAQR